MSNQLEQKPIGEKVETMNTGKTRKIGCTPISTKWDTLTTLISLRSVFIAIIVSSVMFSACEETKLQAYNIKGSVAYFAYRHCMNLSVPANFEKEKNEIWHEVLIWSKRHQNDTFEFITPCTWQRVYVINQYCRTLGIAEFAMQIGIQCIINPDFGDVRMAKEIIKKIN